MASAQPRDCSPQHAQSISAHKKALGPRRQESKSTPGRIRTCDLRFRRPLLYPAELRAQPFGRQPLEARFGPRSPAAGRVSRPPPQGKRMIPSSPKQDQLPAVWPSRPQPLSYSEAPAFTLLVDPALFAHRPRVLAGLAAAVRLFKWSPREGMAR